MEQHDILDKEIDNKNKIEALLFASADGVRVEDLARMCNIAMLDDVHSLISKLKGEYKERDSPIIITRENDLYRFAVSEKYLQVIQSINTNTELSTGIMETLAMIAWRQPVIQSAIIKIRSTKAYDHIAELLEKGFISKERFGRSYMLKTTQKFAEYFDIPSKEAIAKVFKDFEVDLKREDGQQTLKIAPHPLDDDVPHLGNLEVYGQEGNAPVGGVGFQTYSTEGKEKLADDSSDKIDDVSKISEEENKDQLKPMQFDVKEKEGLQVKAHSTEEKEPKDQFTFPKPDSLDRTDKDSKGVKTAGSYINVDFTEDADADKEEYGDDADLVRARAKEILDDEESGVVSEETDRDPDSLRLGPYPVQQAKYELEGMKLNQRAKNLMDELTHDEAGLSFMTDEVDSDKAEEMDSDSEVDSKQKSSKPDIVT